MKTIKALKAAKATSLAAALLMTGTLAHAEVTANIGVTSDYLFRGISQTGNTASVSGGIDFSDDSGFYAGTWVGSLGDSVANTTNGTFTGAEVDLYAGFSRQSGAVTWDVGYIHYLYPTTPGAVDYGEIYGSVAVSIFSAGLNYTVVSGDSNEGSSFDENDIYWFIGVGGSLGEKWSVSATLANYLFDNDSDTNNLDYFHYQLDFGRSTDYGDFTFSLVDISNTSLVGEEGDDVRAVVSWNLGF